MIVDLAKLKPGDALPPQTYGPITRTTLALFAGGSGDHNPIHIDQDFARAAGQPDVFAHGMLSMAYLSRYLLSFAPQSALRAFSARFVAITPVNAVVVCSGRIIACDARQARFDLRARVSGGAETVVGEARVAQ
jgi:acyl dehydratase